MSPDLLEGDVEVQSSPSTPLSIESVPGDLIMSVPRPQPLDVVSPRFSQRSSSDVSSPGTMPRVDTWDLLHAEEGTPNSPQRDIENAMVDPLSWMQVQDQGARERKAAAKRAAAQQPRTLNQSLDQRLATWVTTQTDSPIPSFMLSRPRQRPSGLVNVV